MPKKILQPSIECISINHNSAPFYYAELQYHLQKLIHTLFHKPSGLPEEFPFSSAGTIHGHSGGKRRGGIEPMNVMFWGAMFAWEGWREGVASNPLTAILESASTSPLSSSKWLSPSHLPLSPTRFSSLAEWQQLLRKRFRAVLAFQILLIRFLLL
ncbi:hypothetical protein CEXT_35051 [Caerostris extrusa]|uniref:Uncharacterized protein n=1 Tax=Caerostris extrusa TaxID=172846 RepID=A0AAV4VSZ6_CAEEX|nr:hypothetical protein CEXT_35051 [Caerostris extrusa]